MIILLTKTALIRVCLYGMFKTNLDFADLCPYNELDEISCCFIFCNVWELFVCVRTRHHKLEIQ